MPDPYELLDFYETARVIRVRIHKLVHAPGLMSRDFAAAAIDAAVGKNHSLFILLQGAVCNPDPDS